MRLPLLLLLAAAPLHAQQPFEVHEKSIAELQAALRSGAVTARQLVDAYIERIEAYDRRGPSLNAIIVIHPRAREIADSLDTIFARTGEPVGPLHGIPIIVKDNYDTDRWIARPDGNRSGLHGIRRGKSFRGRPGQA